MSEAKAGSRCRRCGAAASREGRVCRSCGTVLLRPPGADTGPVGGAQAVDTDLTVDRATLRQAEARKLTAADELPAPASAAAPVDDARDAWFEESPMSSQTVPPVTVTTDEQIPAGDVTAGLHQGQAAVPQVSGSDVATSSVRGSGAGTPGSAGREGVAPAQLGRLVARVDRSWSARWNRGIRLLRLSTHLVWKQPGLVWVPVTATGVIIGLVVLASLGSQVLPAPLAFCWCLACIAGMATAGTTSQAVIMHRVAAAVDGEAQTNTQSLQAVLPHIQTLAAWGALSLTVGALIRSVERGRGPLGLLLRLFAAAVDVAWSAATFFVIPVVVFEGMGVRAAMRRSRTLLSSVWGEGVVGVGVLAVVLNVAGFAAVGLAILLLAAHVWVLALLVVLVTVIGINLLACVASPVFAVVLYRFATTGRTALDLQPQDLAAAFRPQRRRRTEVPGAAG
ncbi:MAG: DUF6159 family protein [Actinomycetota bacterium]|nr:DUF6159 family protein [Actinomycetota bacterium]